MSMRKQKIKKIFISYAREDIDTARQIYFNLKKFGFDVWFDEECLLPGQIWEVEIPRIIKECSHFIALLSSKSVNKKGYVQKELKIALEVIDEFPESYIFVIPVRLDNCKPSHDKLKKIHWADIFPVYDKGMKQILRALGIDEQQVENFSNDFPPPVRSIEKSPPVDYPVTLRRSEYNRLMNNINRTNNIQDSKDLEPRQERNPREQTKKLQSEMNYPVTLRRSEYNRLMNHINRTNKR